MRRIPLRDETAGNEISWDDVQTDGDAVPSFDLTPEVPDLVGPSTSAVRAAAATHEEPETSAQSVVRRFGQASADMPSVQPVQFMQFDEAKSGAAVGNLDLLMDVPLPVIVELGRTTMLVRDIMALGPGSVIELEKAAGENVDILVNGRLIARGEVVVIEENFGVRIVEFMSNPEKAVQ
jgi:flagellar motor switch protein FliN/FliY